MITAWIIFAVIKIVRYFELILSVTFFKVVFAVAFVYSFALGNKPKYNTVT